MAAVVELLGQPLAADIDGFDSTTVQQGCRDVARPRGVPDPVDTALVARAGVVHASGGPL